MACVCPFSCNHYLCRRHPRILLCIAIITGILLGVFCGFDPSSSISSLMRGCAAASVSIVGRAYVLLLPLFAVILAAFCSKPFGLIPICFLKSFLFSCCLASIWLSFGYAGWLMSGFLLLSDSVAFLLLVKVSFRHVCGFSDMIGYDIFKASLLIIGVSLLECCFVAPFLVWIMNS